MLDPSASEFQVCAHHRARLATAEQRLCAFTLVELLVVITIIAMLIVMLLPSLIKSKEETLFVLCASQLRQQVVAHTGYQASNKFFYPTFGGVQQWEGGVGVNWMTDNGGGFYVQMQLIWNNPGAWSYFCDYLNGGNPPNRKMQKINFCPAIDWENWGPYYSSSFSPGYFQASLPVNAAWYSFAGYAYYTGRKMYRPGQNPAYDMDTFVRHNDPLEILMTDHLKETDANTTVTFNGHPLIVTLSLPYFNPHMGNNPLPTRQGKFNQLTASGAVHRWKYAEATGYSMFPYNYGTRVDPGSSFTHGPYCAEKPQ